MRNLVYFDETLPLHATFGLFRQNIALFNAINTYGTTLLFTCWVFIADLNVVLHSCYTRNSCFNIYENCRTEHVPLITHHNQINQFSNAKKFR